MSPPQQTQIPPQFILLLLLPPMIVLFVWIAASTQNPFIQVGVAAIPVLILLINRIDLWLLIIVCVAHSQIKPPGVLGQLDLFEVLVAGLVGMLMVRHTVAKQSVKREGWVWTFLILFIGIVLFTMYMRGTGFRYFGDTKWGGMRYVKMILMAILPFLVWHVHMTPKQWRIGLVMMVLLGIIPMVADAVYIFSGGRLYHQFLFIQHGTVLGDVEEVLTGGVTRLRTAGGVGLTLVMLPFFLLEPVRRNFWKYCILVSVGVAVASVSGHRLAIVNCVAFVGLYCVYALKRHKALVLVVLAIVGLIGTVFLAGFGRVLPLSAQRAVSFVPFADIEAEAAGSAWVTTRWRLKVWRNAWNMEVPRYLWIGKGYAFEQGMLESLVYTNSYVEMWPIVRVAYHNGPLSLLIGMGIPGLVIGLGLMATGWYRQFRSNRGTWHDPEMHRFHTLLFISFSWSFLSYVLLYGDAFQSFPGFCFLFALQEGIRLADARIPNRATETAGDRALSPARVQNQMQLGQQRLRPV